MYKGDCISNFNLYGKDAVLSGIRHLSEDDSFCTFFY